MNIRKHMDDWRSLPLPMRCLTAALWALVLFGCWEFGVRLLYEAHVPYVGDSNLFMTVGRGILNGLTPYVDLMETKPPAIFLLSALSLRFGGMGLAHGAQVITLLGLFAAMAMTLMREIRAYSTTVRALLLPTAVLFSTVLAMYTASRAGEFFPESFGAFFLALYVTMLAYTRNNERVSWAWILGAGTCLAAGIGFKEPFVITAVAASLFLCETPRELLKKLGIPLLVAMLLGVLLLMVTGYLDAYVRVYLPFMAGRPGSTTDPLWLRGFFWDLVGRDYTAYSLPLGALFVALWTGTIHVDTAGRKPLRDGLFAVALVAFTLWSTRAITYVHSMHQRSATLVLLTALALIVWWRTRDAADGERRRDMFRLCALLIAGYLLVLGPGFVADFLGHHCVFSVPAFFAMSVLLLRRYRDRIDEHATRLLFGLVVAMLAFVTVFHERVPSDRLAYLQTSTQAAQADADLIDDLLDRCDEDRYLHISAIGTNYFAYTRHSPLGPGFVQEKMNSFYPLFREGFLRNLASADILVRGPKAEQLLGIDTDLIGRDFTLTPPPCAGGWKNPATFSVLFRRW